MKSTITIMLVAAALAGALFAGTGHAHASHAKLDVVGPAELTVGETVDIRAVLHSADDGAAIAGATVTFYMEASFGGVDGEAVLGRAVTDDEGAAVLPYEPRSAGEHQLRVEYLTPGAGEPEVATWSHSVNGATGQLYRSTAGVRIPGLNVWVLMMLVGAVWAVLLSIAFRVVNIARAGTEAGILARQAVPGGHATRPPAAGRSREAGGA